MFPLPKLPTGSHCFSSPSSLPESARPPDKSDVFKSDSTRNSLGSFNKLPTSRSHPRSIKSQPLGVGLGHWTILSSSVNVLCAVHRKTVSFRSHLHTSDPTPAWLTPVFLHPWNMPLFCLSGRLQSPLLNFLAIQIPFSVLSSDGSFSASLPYLEHVIPSPLPLSS